MVFLFALRFHLIRLAHAREWIGAWIPYEARETIDRQMDEAKRILVTPDDRLTDAERKWKREWMR
jgi:hypothetical protein